MWLRAGTFCSGWLHHNIAIMLGSTSISWVQCFSYHLKSMTWKVYEKLNHILEVCRRCITHSQPPAMTTWRAAAVPWMPNPYRMIWSTMGTRLEVLISASIWVASGFALWAPFKGCSRWWSCDWRIITPKHYLPDLSNLQESLAYL